MPKYDIEHTRRRLIEVLGAWTFNKLVSSVAETREKGRLRAWQEQHFGLFTTIAGIRIETLDDFLELFGEAAPIPIRKEPITREEYLRRMEENPFDQYLSDDDTPHDWMREAWEIESVREAESHEFARGVSKTGSIWYSKEHLAFLEKSLTLDQQVALFDYIMNECWTREYEFRPQFEQAFPRCVPLLPPPRPRLPDDETPPEVGPPISGLGGEIPF